MVVNLKHIIYCCKQQTIHDRRLVDSLKMKFKVDLLELDNKALCEKLDRTIEYFAVIASPTSLDFDYLGIKANHRILLSMGYDLNEQIGNLRYREIITRNFSSASLVVVDNPILRTVVVNDIGYHGPVFMMPYGCEIQRFIDTDGPNRNVLGTNRSISTIHNNSMIIDAVSKLEPSSYGGFVFVKHGPDSEEFVLKNQRLLSGIPYEMLIGGNEKTTIEFLSKIDIFVSASRSDGSSVSLLEAMAAGKICLVTRNPFNEYWIKDGVNGFTFNNDELSLLEKIKTVLSIPFEHRRQISIKAKARVEDEADWNHNSQKFRDLIETL